MTDSNNIVYSLIIAVLVAAVTYFITGKLKDLRYVRSHKALRDIVDFINTVSYNMAQQLLTAPTPTDKDALKKQLVEDALQQVKEQLPKELKTAQVADSQLQDLVTTKIDQHIKGGNDEQSTKQSQPAAH